MKRTCESLTRREIMEEMRRLGVRGIGAMKDAVRKFEADWDWRLVQRRRAA